MKKAHKLAKLWRPKTCKHIDAGILDIDDVPLAARRFQDLIKADFFLVAVFGIRTDCTQANIDQSAKSVVQTFLRAYRARWMSVVDESNLIFSKLSQVSNSDDNYPRTRLPRLVAKESITHSIGMGICRKSYNAINNLSSIKGIVTPDAKVKMVHQSADTNLKPFNFVWSIFYEHLSILPSARGEGNMIHKLTLQRKVIYL